MTASEVRHYPGCEWICGTHGQAEQYECRCDAPRFRRYQGRPGRTCMNCRGKESLNLPKGDAA